MVSIDNKLSYAVKRGDPMWLWVGSAHLPMDRKDLLHQLRTRKHRCSSIVKFIFMYQVGVGWFATNKLYIMPNEMDDLVSDLASLSLTHNIVGMNTIGSVIKVAFAESEDHTSNIDAEVMEAIVETKSRKST